MIITVNKNFFFFSIRISIKCGMFFLSGEMDNNKKACMMILAKVVEDPQSGSCLNVSYADIAGPVANYNPTGSPYAQNTSAAATFTSPSLNNSVAGMF